MYIYIYVYVYIYIYHSYHKEAGVSLNMALLSSIWMVSSISPGVVALSRLRPAMVPSSGSISRSAPGLAEVSVPGLQMWLYPKILGPILVVPITRTRTYLCLFYWGPLFMEAAMYVNPQGPST